MSITRVDLANEQKAHAETLAKLEAALAENARLREAEAENRRPVVREVQVARREDAVAIARLTARIDVLERELTALGQWVPPWQ